LGLWVQAFKGDRLTYSTDLTRVLLVYRVHVNHTWDCTLVLIDSPAP